MRGIGRGCGRASNASAPAGDACVERLEMGELVLGRFPFCGYGREDPHDAGAPVEGDGENRRTPALRAMCQSPVRHSGTCLRVPSSAHGQEEGRRAIELAHALADDAVGCAAVHRDAAQEPEERAAEPSEDGVFGEPASVHADGELRRESDIPAWETQPTGEVTASVWRSGRVFGWKASTRDPPVEASPQKQRETRRERLPASPSGRVALPGRLPARPLQLCPVGSDAPSRAPIANVVRPGWTAPRPRQCCPAGSDCPLGRRKRLCGSPDRADGSVQWHDRSAPAAPCRDFRRTTETAGHTTRQL
jgi:hypothetical protein